MSAQLIQGVIAKYLGVPFSYGLDCCAFAGDCVEAITGDNPMRQFDYEDEDSANELIESLGGLEAAITHVLGEPYDDFKDGDVCLIEMINGQQAAGIAYNGRVVVRAKNDLMDLPKEAAKKVWCVNADSHR